MSKIKPNIVRGGTAIDLGNNLFLMRGRKHSGGGIDIGRNPRTGLEVEDKEVVQTSPSGLRVFSAQPILGGISPAQYILGGANPNDVFNAQEFWKKANRVTDDGKKYRTGGKVDEKTFTTKLTKKQEGKFQNWYKNVSYELGLDSNPDNPLHAYDYRGFWLENRNKDINYKQPDFHFTDTYKQPNHPTFSIESKYADKKYGIDPKTVGHWEGDNFISGSFNNLIAARTDKPIKELEYKKQPYEPSKEIIDYIKSTEGFRDKWYQDGKGIWTVGYGFTGSKVKKLFPNGMTREQADKYLTDSLNVRKQILERDTPNWDSLNQNQRDALLSYHYNIGEGNYRNSPKMQKGLQEKDWDTVSKNIDAGYNDKKNPGLRKRRDYERNLFNTPVEYKYGGIHIKPSKRGTFTAAAKKHGMSVQGFARKVLANKSNYSSAMVKKANFARNASKWKHKEFGGDMDFNYIIGKNNIYKLGGCKRKAPYGDEIIWRPTSQDLHRPRLTRENVDYGYINGVLYDRFGNAKFDTDIQPAVAVAEKPSSILNIGINDKRFSPYTSEELDAMRKSIVNKYQNEPIGNSLEVTNPITLNNTVPNPGNGFMKPNNNAVKQNKVKGNGINSDLIGAGINLVGNLGSFLINNVALNKMKYYNMLPLRANKLKTNFNINPQLDNIRENVADFEEDTKNNTASSKVALSRRQRMRARGAQAINQLYGQKENIETQLINRDRLNQQQVANQNVSMRNQWRAGLSEFRNKKLEAKAENAVAAINNAADAIAGPSGYLARRDRRLENDRLLARDLLSLELLSATNPNAAPIIDDIIKNGIDSRYYKLLKKQRSV